MAKVYNDYVTPLLSILPHPQSKFRGPRRVHNVTLNGDMEVSIAHYPPALHNAKHASKVISVYLLNCMQAEFQRVGPTTLSAVATWRR